MARLVAVDDEPTADAAAAPPKKPARSTGDEFLRQLGLTARYGMEGLGDNTLSFLSSPIRGAANLFGANLSARPFGDLADRIGLPQPETPTERVIGDVSRGMASASGMTGVAGMAARGANGVTQNVLGTMASQPGMQVASGAGAGAAGGVVREEGGSPLSQFLASVAGGVAPAGGAAAVNGVRNAVSAATYKPNPQNIDIRITQAFQNDPQATALFRNIEPDVLNRIRSQVGEAMRVGGNLNDAAIRRLVDYEALRVSPLRSSLTQDPVDITRERNLAKIGAASSNPDMAQLARRQNTNNARLVEVLNEAGAGRANDAYGTAAGVTSNILGQDARMASANRELYDAYRNATGKDLALDRTYFTNRAFSNLAESGKDAFLPDGVRRWLNQISVGQIEHNGQAYPVPFDVNRIDQYKSVLAAAANTNDGNVRAAVHAIRDALDATPILEPRTHIGPSGNALRVSSQAEQSAQEAIRIANEARAGHRARMEWQRSHPAIQAVVDGMEPDQFMRQFVVGNGNGASVNELARLRDVIGNDPAAVAQVKDYMVRWIKEKATGGARDAGVLGANTDEFAKVSQKALNDALSQIGHRKLELFFTPAEIARLGAAGRVAGYESFQPVGSAVNNSNSGTTLTAQAIDFLTNNSLLRRVPAGQAIVQRMAQPIQNSVALSFSNDIPRGLLAPQTRNPSGVIPLGLLGFSPTEN